jgi:hypothetical protein
MPFLSEKSGPMSNITKSPRTSDHLSPQPNCQVAPILEIERIIDCPMNDAEVLNSLKNLTIDQNKLAINIDADFPSVESSRSRALSSQRSH